MLKALTEFGDSQALIFDSAFLDLAQLKLGDQLDVEVLADGVIRLTPVRPVEDGGEEAHESAE
jgi:antitoxin component of MazEF toxin-antitoxin module